VITKEFRSWDIEEKEYTFFDLYSVSGLPPEMLDNAEQYIGKIDKRNKKIYENDIFADGSFCMYLENRFIKLWLTKDESGRNHWEDITDSDEIVGNITETPDLIEGNQKMKVSKDISILLNKDKQIEELRDALEEVMDWIYSWSPDFCAEEDWVDTQEQVNKALENK
jgi:hypothetical protein